MNLNGDMWKGGLSNCRYRFCDFFYVGPYTHRDVKQKKSLVHTLCWAFCCMAPIYRDIRILHSKNIPNKNLVVHIVYTCHSLDIFSGHDSPIYSDIGISHNIKRISILMATHLYVNTMPLIIESRIVTPYFTNKMSAHYLDKKHEEFLYCTHLMQEWSPMTLRFQSVRLTYRSWCSK